MSSAPSDLVCIRALSGDARAFAFFTFPAFAKHLSDLALPWFATGLFIGDTQAGLALGQLFGAEAVLRSILIAPHRRRCGLATQLLAAWESQAQSLGAVKLWARYTDVLAQRSAFERLLERAGWPTPYEETYRLTGYAGRMGRQGGAWTGVERRILRNGAFRFDPLVIRPEDEEALARMLAQPEGRFFADPRKDEAKLVPELSRAFRINGQLVGWMTALPGADALKHRPELRSSTLIEYKDCYVDAAHWSSGIALAAFYTCFLRQAEIFGEDSIASYITHPGMANMVAFTRRRFAPMAISFRTVFCVVK